MPRRNHPPHAKRRNPLDRAQLAPYIPPERLRRPTPCSSDVDHGQLGGDCPLDHYGTHQCTLDLRHAAHHGCACGKTWRTP